MDLSKLPKLSQTPNATTGNDEVAATSASTGASQSQTPDLPGKLGSPSTVKSDHCRACGLPLRAGVRFCESCGAPARTGATAASAGAEAWISIAIGIILLILTPNTLTFCSSKIFHTTFAPYPDPTRPFPAKCDFILYDDGSKQFYRDRPEFWSDLAITTFAAAMIVEGFTLILSRRRSAMIFALGLTVAATLLNLGYVIATTSKYGWPILSLLAVVFGVYIAIQQWTHLRAAR